MPAAFQLLAAHPVLDFINTLDNRFAAQGPCERLRHYADLLEFCEQTALLDPPQAQALSARVQTAASARTLRVARDLRESLAAIFYGRLGDRRQPPHSAVKKLERHFLEAAEHQELRVAQGAGWTWGRHSTDPSLPVWLLAQSAVSLLTSSALEQVHQCRSGTCRWLFLDSSKNHSRRWCDMKICGNRAKVRRFQARTRR